MWFLFSLIATLGWGFADLFYKKGTDESDRFSHLKIAVWVGFVMGVTSVCLLPFCETAFSFKGFAVSAVRYFPASLGYIVSMVVGYAGLRYLEISVISPVQNASGAFSAVAMLVFFIATGRITDLKDEFSYLDVFGTLITVCGVILLAVVEKRTVESDKDVIVPQTDSKYRYGALALIFPMLYCVFDTLGTAADGIILDEKNGINLGELDVIVIYGFTFFTAAVICWIYMLVKTKKPYNPFKIPEMRYKGTAALCEQFGQIFYVYAMSENPVLAAPMIASYCFVSVVLSRLILKERLTKAQNACIALIIFGIVLLGISEGLAG